MYIYISILYIYRNLFKNCLHKFPIKSLQILSLIIIKYEKYS